VRGSWWAHPAAHSIFRALEELAGRADVIVVKLVAGKDTFVHERLWPQLLAITMSHEPWQFAQLTKNARDLYNSVLHAGEAEECGPDARLLESRLLVRGKEFHTTAGRHQKKLESWEHWAQRIGIRNELPVCESKKTFERIYPTAKWPWSKLPSDDLSGPSKSYSAQSRK